MSGALLFFRACASLTAQISGFAANDPVLGSSGVLAKLFERYEINAEAVHECYRKSILRVFKTVEELLSREEAEYVELSSHARQALQSFLEIVSVDDSIFRIETLQLCKEISQPEKIEKLLKLQDLPLAEIIKTFQGIVDKPAMPTLPGNLKKALSHILNRPVEDSSIQFICYEDWIIQVANYHFHHIWFHEAEFSFPKNFYSYRHIQQRITFVDNQLQGFQLSLEQAKKRRDHEKIKQLEAKARKFQESHVKMAMILQRHGELMRTLSFAKKATTKDQKSSKKAQSQRPTTQQPRQKTRPLTQQPRRKTKPLVQQPRQKTKTLEQQPRRAKELEQSPAWEPLVEVEEEDLIVASARVEVSSTPIVKDAKREQSRDPSSKVRDELPKARQLLSSLGFGAKIEVTHSFTSNNSSEFASQLKEVRDIYNRINDDHLDKVSLANELATALHALECQDEALALFRFALKRRPSLTQKEQRLVGENAIHALLNFNELSEATELLQGFLHSDPQYYAVFDYQQYQLEKILGIGSLGTVHLCEDRYASQRVVIHTFWQKHEGDIKKILAGAFAMRELKDKRVANIHDIRKKNDRPYIVSEFVEGMDLYEYMKNRPMDVDEALSTVREICWGLHALHNAPQPIVHGNIKPANILYNPETKEVKLVDGGLSHFLPPLAAMEIGQKRSSFRQGNVICKKAGEVWHYLAPERKKGQIATPASDVFSAGKILMFLLTGQSPPTENIQMLERSTQKHVGALVGHTLEQNPEKRYSALNFARELERLLQKSPTPVLEKPVIETAHVEEIYLPEGFVRRGKDILCAKDGAMQCYVPASKFYFGSQDMYSKEDEKPEREIYLGAYFIDKYPVTWGQYKKFLQDTHGWMRWNSQMLPLPSWEIDDEEPVVNITWHEASAYAAWAGRTLVSEAQWEKAAKGGINLDHERHNPLPRRAYPWGDENPDHGNYFRANYNKTPIYGNKKTSPVGKYAAGVSPYGCLDMAGNVLEWCADWYQKDAYKKGEVMRDPKGPESGTERVLRGGSWGSLPWALRNTRRSRNIPDHRGENIGFRCCLALK